MRKNSIRNTRINAGVLRELSEVIHNDIKDPRTYPMINVVFVEVTPDLKYCKAYISALGNEDVVKATTEGLRGAEGYVCRELTRRINLHNTPELKFISGQSTEYGVNMSKPTDKVTKDLHQREGQDEEGEEEEV